VTEIAEAPSRQPGARTRIAGAFARAHDEGRIALVAFLTAGYPSPAESDELFAAIVRGGADLIEVGVPFSDPIAEGRTIQRSSQVAIEHRVGLDDCLALVRRLRQARSIAVPMLLMGYYNPIFHYGLDRFAADAAAAGVDGVIVPDLPTEESDDLAAALRAHGLDFVFLLAPTSTDARIAAVAERASGFIYCVSLTGVTGSRAALPDLRTYLARVRAATDLPLAIGFGISTPDHVRQVAALADGAIVGSALIDAIDAAPSSEKPAAAEAFVRRLRVGATIGDE
jgi:tryptophan synthase alpha chain